MVKTNLTQACETCGTPVDPAQAENSYHETFEVGDGGTVLCRKHLDNVQYGAHKRQQ